MKRKDLLLFAIGSFIVILAWIVFGIYHKATSSTVPASLQVQVNPISPNFDTKTLEDLKSREKVTPVFDASQITPTPTQPVQIATPLPSPTLSQQPTQPATSGGSLQ